MIEVVDRFAILMPVNLLTSTAEEIVKSVNKIVTQYPKLLSRHFRQEMLTIRSALNKEIHKLSNKLILQEC